MLLPKRVWKDIPGYEGLYQVSNTGKVRSLNYRRTGKKQILKQYINNTGYKRVALRKNNKVKWYLVHRLVAQAFIPNPHNYPIINHKDENPANNAVWNLEWCTMDYNIDYSKNTSRTANKQSFFYLEKSLINLSKIGDFLVESDYTISINN